jgi:hypothetical protein
VNKLLKNHNVSFAHISVYTIHDNADRSAESAKSGTKGYSSVEMNHAKTYGCESLTILLHKK